MKQKNISLYIESRLLHLNSAPPTQPGGTREDNTKPVFETVTRTLDKANDYRLEAGEHTFKQGTKFEVQSPMQANSTKEGLQSAGISLSANDIEVIEEGSILIQKYPKVFTFKRDITGNLTKPLTISGISITGTIESKVEKLTPEQKTERLKEAAAMATEEVENTATADRQELEKSIGEQFAEIFSSDASFATKLLSVIQLIFDKLLGKPGSQGESSATAAEGEPAQASQKSVDQVREQTQKAFDLTQYQKNPVIDLLSGPFVANPSPGNLNDLLTFQATKESTKKRLILSPQAESFTAPEGFDAKSIEGFNQSVREKNKVEVESVLKQPLAIKTSPKDQGYINLLSFMKTFVDSDSTNTDARNGVLDNIKRQFVTDGSKHKTLAEAFLAMNTVQEKTQ